MKFDPAALPEAAADFLTERHLATLTTVRSSGALHVVPVGFTFDSATQTARVITSGDTVKARNASRLGATAALCSVDGARWITLSGPVRVEAGAEAVADAERRYAERYRPPRINPKRIVVIMTVTSVSASVRLG
ncbi:MAG TPA: pyridoxamine 5'-phosphate oxidase family protein [Propionibacteriaceae bacterium]|nr:pyridoxamine 5'-phosphate oxidase family protein [Propionibacteriaceae bacterium]